jgi:hypothetical protein
MAEAVSVAVVALTLAVAAASALVVLAAVAALARRAPVLESAAAEVESDSATHASPAEFRTLRLSQRTSIHLSHRDHPWYGVRGHVRLET